MAALGISRSNGLFDLSSKVNRPYAMFFTCALYLTIGPFFAIPRCATTSFTVGLEQVLPQNGSSTLYLLLFSAAFFAAALFFALRPGKILTWVGKILNPCFLVFLGILVVVALLSPSAAIADVEPLGDYASQPFFAGFLEGYNTMDALASLAFGIIVVQVIRDLGVDDPTAVAGSTVRAGIFSSLLMAFIYIAVTIAGTQSRGVLEASENGGTALAQIAAVYDLIIALPESVFNAIHGPAIKAFGQQYLPFANLGLGWICPTLIGAVIGLILHFMRGNRAKA